MKPPELKTWQAILLGFISGAITLAAVFYFSLPEKMVPLTILPTPSLEPLIIHVTGAVSKPGVYQLSPESRISDGITAAGGASELADLNQINLAAPLVDGQKVYVPGKGEIIAQQNPLNSPVVKTPLVIHLNFATAKDLEQLPGIGEEKAAAIIAERDKRVRFQSIEDLLAVSGITKNLYQLIQPFILLD
jgi:competence protein ComEA